MADETNDDREEWLRKTRERLEREEAEKKRPKAAANGLDGKPELPREEALRQLRLDIGQLNDASTEDDIAVIIERIASRNDLDPLTHERLLQTIKEQIKTTSIVLLRKQLTASRKQQIHDNHGLDDIDLVREYPGGPPLALESNAIALIRAHPQMRGVFALDEFRQRSMRSA
jgi:hypothetical protein